MTPWMAKKNDMFVFFSDCLSQFPSRSEISTKFDQLSKVDIPAEKVISWSDIPVPTSPLGLKSSALLKCGFFHTVVQFYPLPYPNSIINCTVFFLLNSA